MAILQNSWEPTAVQKPKSPFHSISLPLPHHREKSLIPAWSSHNQLGGFHFPLPPSSSVLPDSSQDVLVAGCTPAADLCPPPQSLPDGRQHAVSAALTAETIISCGKEGTLTHHVCLLHIFGVELPDSLLQSLGLLNEAHTVVKICFKPLDKSFHVSLLQELYRNVNTWPTGVRCHAPKLPKTPVWTAAENYPVILYCLSDFFEKAPWRHHTARQLTCWDLDGGVGGIEVTPLLTHRDLHYSTCIILVPRGPHQDQQPVASVTDTHRSTPPAEEACNLIRSKI